MNTTLKKIADNLWAKLDFENPTGSAKYRPALYIIVNAFEKGLISKGGTVIEATSGNTGIALAYVAKEYECNAVIVMPSNMSHERITLIESYGGKVVLTPAEKGMQGAVEKAIELKSTIRNSFIADQFNNPENVKSHFETTGPEIYEQTDGKVDVFIAGIGTGGTISGVGQYLKQKNPEVKIIGVEPSSSPLLTKGFAGQHKIQGIGANFIPSILDRNIIDEVIDVSDDDAIEYTKKLIKKENIQAGISAGAAYFAALEVAKRPEMKNKHIVVFFTDKADRYDIKD